MALRSVLKALCASPLLEIFDYPQIESNSMFMPVGGPLNNLNILN